MRLERRTATGNEAFSLFTRLGTTAFVILSVFTLIETIYLTTRALPKPKNEKRPLSPVAVRRSKTPLLKLANINLSPLLTLSQEEHVMRDLYFQTTHSQVSKNLGFYNCNVFFS